MQLSSEISRVEVVSCSLVGEVEEEHFPAQCRAILLFD